MTNRITILLITLTFVYSSGQTKKQAIFNKLKFENPSDNTLKHNPDNIQTIIKLPTVFSFTKQELQHFNQKTYFNTWLNYKPIISYSAYIPMTAQNETSQIRKHKRAIAKAPKEVENWVKLGRYYYVNGRYGEAEWVIKQARLLKPDDQYILWLLGVVYYELRENSLARTHLTSVYLKFKGFEEAIDQEILFSYLGKLNFEEGKLFNAAYYYSKATDVSAKNWRIHFMLGTVELLRGGSRYSDAYLSFEEARKLVPKNTEVLNMCARSYGATLPKWGEEYSSERYEKAIDKIQMAIKADPNLGDNYELLGLVYAQQKRYDAATRQFKKAVALEPDSAASRYWLAKVLLLHGDVTSYAEAESLLLRAIAINPDYWYGNQEAPHVTLLTSHLISTGRTKEALALMTWEEDRNNN